MTQRTGGELLVECLVEQGVKRVFCVPGESYLAALDGLHGQDRSRPSSAGRRAAPR